MNTSLLTLAFGHGAQTFIAMFPYWWFIAVAVGIVIVVLGKMKVRESLGDDPAEDSSSSLRPEHEDPNFPGIEHYIPKPRAADETPESLSASP